MIWEASTNILRSVKNIHRPGMKVAEALAGRYRAAIGKITRVKLRMRRRALAD